MGWVAGRPHHRADAGAQAGARIGLGSLVEVHVADALDGDLDQVEPERPGLVQEVQVLRLEG